MWLSLCVLVPAPLHHSSTLCGPAGMELVILLLLSTCSPVGHHHTWLCPVSWFYHTHPFPKSQSIFNRCQFDPGTLVPSSQQTSLFLIVCLCKFIQYFIILSLPSSCQTAWIWQIDLYGYFNFQWHSFIQHSTHFAVYSVFAKHGFNLMAWVILQEERKQRGSETVCCRRLRERVTVRSVLV